MLLGEVNFNRKMNMEIPQKNTDIELFREERGNYYSPSLFVTIDGKIGINVGGSVFIMTLSEWHERAKAFIVNDSNFA